MTGACILYLPQCYSHLTEWQDLEKAVMVNIDDTGGRPKLDKIWEDAYHQVHIHTLYVGIGSRLSIRSDH